MKIFTKFICLLIVAISLLTGCDINSKCNCLIENNVGYFRDVSLSHSFMKNRKIINSSQELRDIFYNNEKDIMFVKTLFSSDAQVPFPYVKALITFVFLHPIIFFYKLDMSVFL